MLKDISLSPPAAYVLTLLEQGGFEAYAVGGCVRDSLLGRPVSDWDVTTSALPEEVGQVFRDCRVIETGLRHGTVTVQVEQVSVEVTTFRADGTYSDGRHPDCVTFSRTLADDLARRDFTVNAMAYSPTLGLRDLYGGRADLTAGILRCVGDPERRFSEDGLRILRAVRFAAQLGFTVEPITKRALYHCAEMLGCVSAERKYTELCKAITAQYAAGTIAEYAPLLREIVPVAADAGTTLEQLPDALNVRLAALLREETPEDAVAALRKLRADGETVRTVRTLLHGLAEEMTGDLPSVRRMVGRYGVLLPDVLRLKKAVYPNQKPLYPTIQGLKDTIEEQKLCCTLAQLEVNGHDLMNMGIVECAVGDTLTALLDAVIDGHVPNDRGILLELAQSMSKENR